jgi:drug/metabolite transporter (DMT)-like permease
MFANTIRMMFCILIGFGMILFDGNIHKIVPSVSLLAVSALSGITTSVFVVCWLISVKKGAYMMLDVFLMLGVLVPLLAGKLFFNESIKTTQWIGIGILFIAVYIMCSYNNSIKGKMTITSLILLIVCGVANGLTDFSQKLFMKMTGDTSIAIFNFYTYIFSALTLIPVLLVFEKGNFQSACRNGKRILAKAGVFVVVMAICLFANSFFKTLAAEHLPATQLYPLNQGGSLILASLMAAIFFKEKPTLSSIFGIVTAFVGLLFINVF